MRSSISGKDLLTTSRFDEMQEGQRRRLSHNDAFTDDDGDDRCGGNGGDGCGDCVNPLDGNRNQNTKNNHVNHAGKNKGKSKKHNRKRRGST